MMRQGKSRVKKFGSGRTREWATDFLIGIGLFALVAFFASTHTDSALPAPLAKTQSVLEHTISNQVIAKNPLADVPREALLQNSQSRDFLVANNGRPMRNNIMMVFMALVFSTLLTLTIQFWRNLRRAYASPRRKRGKS